ncbi:MULTISPECIES: hypothetical protein [Bradyrhizobium]|uniref:Uncharacterized protein n=1 Tax=Bradyrhizobium zhanjiangense TaxID=1325107 RepID=A0A4Q0Q9X1_9BRAD|nr:MULTISPECIES: hypothetical protein [Bradyrhizobium]RXG85356.1 hypothetical protein EAS61_36510 [Bradyrhizobium zhanjiangense]SDJ33753.1 hypothetical protein SAMN05216338_104653 [Bradyrhizobium sp. Rc2d]
MSNVVELQLPDRFENEADIQNIVLLIDMLVVLLAQPDAETAIDGMHRVTQIISDHAHALRDRLQQGGLA